MNLYSPNDTVASSVQVQKQTGKTETENEEEQRTKINK